MAKVKSFVVKDNILILVGIDIGGYADGTFITVTPDVETIEKVRGTDNVSRIIQSYESASCEINLSVTSASNDYLSGLVNADRATGSSVVPLYIRDVSGTTLVFCENAWVSGFPTFNRSNAAEQNTWKIEMGECDIHLGGNN